MQTVVEESVPNSLHYEDGDVFGLDAVQAEGGEPSGNVRSATALQLHQHAPGQQ